MVMHLIAFDAKQQQFCASSKYPRVCSKLPPYCVLGTPLKYPRTNGSDLRCKLMGFVTIYTAPSRLKMLGVHTILLYFLNSIVVIHSMCILLL